MSTWVPGCGQKTCPESCSIINVVTFFTSITKAKLRKAVIETAGPSGATLQLLTEARDKMEIDQPAPSQNQPQGRVRQAAARCWALLLASYRFRGIA